MNWTKAIYGATPCDKCKLDWADGWPIGIGDTGAWTVRTAAPTDLENGIEKNISQRPVLHNIRII